MYFAVQSACDACHHISFVLLTPYPHAPTPLSHAHPPRRHVAETDMNVRSSRSHTIFKMVIESRALESPGVVLEEEEGSEEESEDDRPPSTVTRDLVRARSLPPRRTTLPHSPSSLHTDSDGEVDVEEVLLCGTDIGTVAASIADATITDVVGLRRRRGKKGEV